jgi:hypothetical protein
MNNCFRLIFVALCIFAVLGYCLQSEIYVFAQTDQTTSKLQTASNALERAFNVVLGAEKAGGNVTQLLVKLNTAGVLLAEAQNAYNSGNTTNVSFIADNVRQIADQVNSDAVNLRNASVLNSQNSFWLTLVFSVVGAVVFGVSLFIVWRRFKRDFIKKLLGSKPEVVSNTT